MEQQPSDLNLTSQVRQASFATVISRICPQPLTGILASTGSLAAICMYCILSSPQPSISRSWQIWLLSSIMATLTAVSYVVPIHLRHNMKLYMATVPLFILAVTALPAQAAALALAGTFAREMMARKQTGAFLSDAVSSASVTALNTLVASTIAMPAVFANHTVGILLAAAAFWALEALLLPVVITPVSGERPFKVIQAFVRTAGVPDAVQVSIGVLGAIVAEQHAWALSLLVIPAYFIYASFKNAREMHETTREVLVSLADAVDLRDSYTGGHSRRVAEVTANLLQALGKRGAEADLVGWAARVHDIGKIGIPDAVLLKEGRLESDEQAMMQTHPEKGAELLRQHPEFARGIEVVRHHHERWDGTGYPSRLSGEDIPWGGRIVSVADSFDAMTSDRPYRKGLTVVKACRILSSGRGTQWDPDVIDTFLTLLETDEVAWSLEVAQPVQQRGQVAVAA